MIHIDINVKTVYIVLMNAIYDPFISGAVNERHLPQHEGHRRQARDFR